MSLAPPQSNRLKAIVSLEEEVLKMAEAVPITSTTQTKIDGTIVSFFPLVSPFILSIAYTLTFSFLAYSES